LAHAVTVWISHPAGPATLVLWLPWVLIGGGIAWLRAGSAVTCLRRWSCTAALAGFYAILCHGMDLQQAETPTAARPFDTGGSSRCSPPRWSSTPTLGHSARRPTIMVVALLTILEDAAQRHGPRACAHRDLDLEKDLRATGIANIAGARAAACPIPDDPGTMLGQRMGLRSVLPGLSAAAGCLLIFIYGATLLSSCRRAFSWR
jgi:MFS superfamily sulfate permease-like transporter